jgi:hypothetical protein
MTDGCVHLQQQLEIPSARSWAAPIRATVLGQLSSFRPHREQTVSIFTYSFVSKVMFMYSIKILTLHRKIYDNIYCKYVRSILCRACVYVTRVIKWVHLQIFLLFAESIQRRKIRLIESNAKCRYLKKWTCEGTLRQVFYLSEDPLILWPNTLPPPLHTVYGYCTY